MDYRNSTQCFCRDKFAKYFSGLISIKTVFDNFLGAEPIKQANVSKNKKM